RRGAEGLARLLVGQFLGGEPAQLVVDQRQQLAGRVGIALRDGGQDACHVTHQRHPGGSRIDRPRLRWAHRRAGFFRWPWPIMNIVAAWPYVLTIFSLAAAKPDGALYPVVAGSLIAGSSHWRRISTGATLGWRLPLRTAWQACALWSHRPKDRTA